MSPARRLALAAVFAAATASAAEPPVVARVEPPNWWVGQDVHSVRLLVEGRGLSGARIEIRGVGVAVGRPSVNRAGTALFVDVDISADALPGTRGFAVVTPVGRAEFRFPVDPKTEVAAGGAGFSPDDVLYQIMPDRFDDGDPSNDDPPKSRGLWDRTKIRSYHGGDLAGVERRLDYLGDLGVTGLWLTPVYDNDDRPFEPTWFSSVPFTDYHGYGPVDFYAVDEHLGDLSGLRRLIERAHARNIKILLDQVVNHTGARHRWTRDRPTESWFHGSPGAHPKNSFQPWVLADPHASAAQKRAVLDGWLDDNQPDLDQEDPEVRRYLIQNLLWWANETGADGFRFDAYDFVPRDFWREAIGALRRQHPRMTFVGEVYVPVPDAALIGDFLSERGAGGAGAGLDSAFDFPLREAARAVFLDGAPASELARALGRDRLYPDPGALVTFIGLHDDPRFMGRPGASARALELAFSFLLTTRGLPMIYAGDEIGLAGGAEPDNRRDFPGGWKEDARDAFEPAGRTGQENEIRDLVRRLLRLRGGSEALRAGRLTGLFAGDKAYAYARFSGKSWAIVVLNTGTETATVDASIEGLGIPDGTLRDRIGGAAAAASGGRLRAVVAPRSAALYLSE